MEKQMQMNERVQRLIDWRDSTKPGSETEVDWELVNELLTRIKVQQQQHGDLLARVHGDGGHHIDEVGWEVASKEAEKIYLDLRSVEEEHHEALSELHHIDEVLARRPALDGFTTRWGKIEHCIKTAAAADEHRQTVERLKEKIVELDATIAYAQRKVQ